MKAKNASKKAATDETVAQTENIDVSAEEVQEIVVEEANEVVDAAADGVVSVASYEIPELDETLASDTEEVTEIASEIADEVEDAAADGVINVASYQIPELDEMRSDVVETETVSVTKVTAHSNTSDEVKITVNANGAVVSEAVVKPVALAAPPVSTITKEATPMATQSPNSSSSNDDISDWVVMPESSWPPPIFIKKTATPNERFYLKHRWHSQWKYYDDKASESKTTYYRLQSIVVIGSLVIPAIVSFAATIARFLAGTVGMFDETTWRIGIDFITIIISLLVAGAAAIETLYKYGENWSSYRSAAEELQAEKNYYDMGAGPYVNNPNPFATFVDRVEGIVANQNGKYFQAVQQQLQKQAAENEEIIASFKSGDDDDEYELSVARQTVPAPQAEPEPEV